MPRILQFALLGQPVLREVAKLVTDIKDNHFQELIDDIIATLAYDGGVGIAAPQVHESSRMFVMTTFPVPFYPVTPTMEPTPIINPKIISHSDETISYWESCKSIPEIRGKVQRHKTIEVDYRNCSGEKEARKFSDFASIIFQHEFDHLNGIVYLDRVEDAKNIITEKEYQRILKSQ